MGPIRVLLVDDDEDEYILTQDLLDDISNADYQLEWVATYSDGLRAIKNEKYDVYLIDYRLGDHTGLDLLQAARAMGNPVPMILLTGVGDFGIDMKAMAAGAADYLVKGDMTALLLERSIRYAINHARTLESLRISEQRYAAALKSANDGLWDWDLQSNEVYYSPRWKFILGYAENELDNNLDEWLKRVHPEDRERLIDELNLHKNAASGLLVNEHRLLHRDGKYRWMLTRGTALTDSQGNALSRIAGSLADITDRKLFEEQLLHDALHDALTGLPNRVLLMERLTNALARQQRYPDYRYALLFLDLDHFKVINDSFGHMAGDQLLKLIADRLRSCLRPGDTIARLGGDEFAVFMEYIENTNEIEQVAHRIEGVLERPAIFNGNKLTTTGSIGIAIGNTEYVRPEEILRDADTAMYRAKSAGKARFIMFDKNMRSQTTERIRLEHDLRQALQRDEFLLTYQPIITVATREILGFEALVRWDHPQLGLVSPTDFIAIAEETELIIPMGWWVIEEACRRAKSLQSYRSPDQPLPINVNLSAKQFAREDLVERITEILDKTGLARGCLNLEITESTIMEGSLNAVGKLHQLKELGVHCLIDDFGTGYFSLNYLCHFPGAALKIDRSFIKRMGESRPHAAIVETIIGLAHNLQMYVIAEGVETEEQFHQLKTLNCDHVQGFWCSPPLEREQAAALLESS